MLHFLANVQPTTNIGDYLIDVGGPLGIIILGLLVALVYYVRKADRLQKEKDEQMELRLQEAKDNALATAIPFQELTRFVGTLYEQSVRGNGKES